MNTGNYLPEWQIYLLKKLALDAKALSGRSLTTRDFLYVTEKEARGALVKEVRTCLFAKTS